MKLEEKKDKNEKTILFIVDVCIVIAIAVILSICFGLFNERKPMGDSGRAVEYSGQSRSTTDSIVAVSERLGSLAEILGEGLPRVSDGLGLIADGLGQNATDIRQYALRLQSIAPTVKEMENEVLYLRWCVSEFFDWYYDYLDSEIEQELGIRIPK